MPLDYETLGNIIELIETLLDYIEEHPDDRYDAPRIDKAERTLIAVRAAQVKLP